MKTSAPASTKARAMALPRPLLPPVTSATRPFRLNSVLCIDLPLQLADDHKDRLNVRAGLPPVNQPIPGAHKASRVCPLDTAAQNGTILQNDLKPLECYIRLSLLHLATLDTPLYTGAVARPGRNNGVAI